MLFKRRECKKCGVRFTPEVEGQRRCSDCRVPFRKRPREKSAVIDASGQRMETSDKW